MLCAWEGNRGQRTLRLTLCKCHSGLWALEGVLVVRILCLLYLLYLRSHSVNGDWSLAFTEASGCTYQHGL